MKTILTIAAIGFAVWLAFHFATKANTGVASATPGTGDNATP